MKKLFLSTLFSCFILLGFSQKIEQTNQSETISNLKYAPEIPNPDTYTVQVNSTGKEVPNEILEQLNFYRMVNTDFLWKVNENLEILIYSIHKSASIKPIVD